MKEYHKIQTVFLRDPENRNKTLLDGQYAKPEFGYLAGCKWEATEKIDGTNIRVHIDEGGKVTLGGKTDDSQIPATLVARLQELFIDRGLGDDLRGLTLCGEGYGRKIQKVGSLYNPDVVDFILFDVRAGDLWLRRGDVMGIADRLGIRYTPTVGAGHMPLRDAVSLCREGFRSLISDDAPGEGLVLRPVVELLDRQGERIITKIKCKDFAGN